MKYDIHIVINWLRQMQLTMQYDGCNVKKLYEKWDVTNEMWRHTIRIRKLNKCSDQMQCDKYNVTSEMWQSKCDKCYAINIMWQMDFDRYNVLIEMR